jgi:hypothetical protein
VAESVGLMAAYCYILERINIKSCDGIIPSIQMDADLTYLKEIVKN